MSAMAWREPGVRLGSSVPREPMVGVVDAAGSASGAPVVGDGGAAVVGPSPGPTQGHPSRSPPSVAHGGETGVGIADDATQAAMFLCHLKSTKFEPAEIAAMQGHSSVNGSANLSGSSSGSGNDSSSKKRRKDITSKPKKKKASSTGSETDMKSLFPPRSECAVKVKDAETQETNWILCSIVRYHSDLKKFEVLDAAENEGDDEKPKGSGKSGKNVNRGVASGGERHFKVPKNKIRIVPQAENSSRKLAIGTRVMALYPDTTVFYPATVKGRSQGEQYLLEFDDEDTDEEDPLKVEARYVFLLKDLS